MRIVDKDQTSHTSPGEVVYPSADAAKASSAAASSVDASSRSNDHSQAPGSRDPDLPGETMEAHSPLPLVTDKRLPWLIYLWQNPLGALLSLIRKGGDGRRLL